ncbi:MAG TPA: beta-ketoacyl synthase N-terminal-like domain-containing protein, partial [Planctomycetota bacterium]|nr:beta-ketoacyl synthase N-terminal-like domain-containing protein [Planctomycetota bacterium]
MAKASEEGPVELIAVTGLGIGTCLGWGLEATWKGIRSGASGLGPITRFALGDYPVRAGGEAPPAPAESPSAVCPDELEQLAAACLEACRGAGHENGVFPEPHRSALVIGSSLAGSSSGEAFLDSYAARGPRGADYGKLEGYYIEGHLDLLARRFGILGPSILVSNACAAGASSIAKGASLLCAGRADRVLCAGYDPLSIFTFSGFGSLQALSVTHMKPFSAERDGMLLGDGYAALVLERLPDARARGATLQGTLRGHGESADSHHLTHPHPEGSG